MSALISGRAAVASQNLNSTSSLHLPKIVHPALKAAGNTDPANLNITARSAVSRGATSLGTLADKFAKEENINVAKSSKDSSSAVEKNYRSSKKLKESLNSQSMEFSYQIPDGIKAVYSPDANKVSMPIFGTRPATSASQTSNNNNLNTSRPVSTVPSQKIDMNEYYNILRDKLKSNSHEIKNKFKNADPTGKGGVTKEALAHIVASILGPSKQLSHQNYLKLLEKLGLKSSTVIKYEDFRFCFDDLTNDGASRRSESAMSSEQPLPQTPRGLPVTRKATQVFVILKEKGKSRNSDLLALMPQVEGGESRKIFKIDLTGLLSKLSIKMEEEEFNKLWIKFDAEEIGFIKSEVFAKKLGVETLAPVEQTLEEEPPTTAASSTRPESIPQAQIIETPSNNYQVRKPSTAKKQQNPVEKWLKKRFREGFTKMKKAFEEMDPTHTGQVRRDQFISVLKQQGLHLDGYLLDSFLQRCEIRTGKNSNLVPYTDFLSKFQSRSDQGLMYRFIAVDDDEDEDDDDRPMSIIGQTEQKLIKVFQNDFLNLLQKFRKLDRAKSNSLSKKEFRAAIESYFSIELTDREFDEFIAEIPRTDNDRIHYLEFMTKFDTDSSSTLFDAVSLKNEDFKPKLIKKYDPIEEVDEDDFYDFPDNPESGKKKHKVFSGRPAEELKEIIKEVIKSRFRDVMRAWSEIDTLSHNEMTKANTYQLLKRLKITPEVTHDEVESLWRIFILKDNKKLDFNQFVRQIAYSKKSAAYENAKKAPPTRGDSDAMMLSKKLSTARVLVRETVVHKLGFLHDNLKKCFKELDPYSTNHVLKDEFEEILLDLCPDLNRDELNHFCSLFENPNDKKINYVEFLKPYAPKSRQRNDENQTDSSSSRVDLRDPLVVKIRTRLGDHFKELRKAFKQADYKNDGLVSVQSFKDAIKATRSYLSDEDLFELVQRLDKDMSGMINYNKFINDYIKAK